MVAACSAPAELANPLAGDPFRWASFGNGTLTVYSAGIDEYGRSELQIYHRTLTETGLDVTFVRLADEDIKVQVTGTLRRVDLGFSIDWEFGSFTMTGWIGFGSAERIKRRAPALIPGAACLRRTLFSVPVTLSVASLGFFFSRGNLSQATGYRSSHFCYHSGEIS